MVGCLSDSKEIVIYFVITFLNYLLHLTVIEHLFLRPFENITFCINIKTECR